MAAKFQFLAAATLLCIAFAVNDRTIKTPIMLAAQKITMKKLTDAIPDPETAKELSALFEESLEEEDPGLEDEKTREQGGRHQSMLRTNLRTSKVRPVAPHVPQLSLKPKEDDEPSQFEKDVSDLISGLSASGYSATPFGDDENDPVARIANLITEEMMPEVVKAHDANQATLDGIETSLNSCSPTLKSEKDTADLKEQTYTSASALHKTCRENEAVLYTANVDCHSEWLEAKEIMELKCKQYDMVKDNFGEYVKNQDIMKKAASEDTEAYIKRVTETVCGKPLSCADCTAGDTSLHSGEGGYLDVFEQRKAACETATTNFNGLTTKCKTADASWHSKREDCDVLQDNMDKGACEWNIAVKDVCEKYDSCDDGYMASYTSSVEAIEKEEVDRKAEWRGLKRMKCIIDAFSDGKVEIDEINACKNETYTVDHLNIDYPGLPEFEPCTYGQLFPSTPEYKIAEFDPLPVLAKGKVGQYECGALKSVSLTPGGTTVHGCACTRVGVDSTWSAGALVKCTNCLPVYRSTEENSCPEDTKLWSPRSREDWASFIKAEQPQNWNSTNTMRKPNFIVDITRPEDGLGGGRDFAMNYATEEQQSWVTADGSAWWLRSDAWNGGFGTQGFGAEYTAEAYADYQANCYLDVLTVATEDTVTFNDDKCEYYSTSYYCQSKQVNLSPKAGSPAGCTCSKVDLVGHYSASSSLIKCEKCLDVSKSVEKNSCPDGTKLFSPRTREDWKTFIASATALRAPNWIIDIVRSDDGCGSGCTSFAMKSDSPEQATWHTSDGSPWWLRDSSYSQPSGDYSANCYMDLWHAPPNEDAVTFDDHDCTYHSRSYYCQPILTTSTTTTTVALTYDQVVQAYETAYNKTGLEKQLLLLEAGRLEYIAGYMKDRGEVIQENDLAGSDLELMEIATKWGEELVTQVKKARKVAWDVNAALEAAAVDAKAQDQEEMKKHTSLLALQSANAKKEFDELMSLEDLVSPRVAADDLSSYTKVMHYYDAASENAPTTCSGPSVAKPIAGKSYAECASACGRLEGACMGFTFFPSKLCFLHRSIRIVTDYTGCNQTSNQTVGDDELRLACVVKTTDFTEKYNSTRRADTMVIDRKQANRCPTYEDEGDVTSALEQEISAVDEEIDSLTQQIAQLHAHA